MFSLYESNDSFLNESIKLSNEIMKKINILNSFLCVEKNIPKDISGLNCGIFTLLFSVQLSLFDCVFNCFFYN